MSQELLRKEFDKHFGQEFQQELEPDFEQEKMFIVLAKRVYMETMELLGEDDRAEYKKMIEENANSEKVEDFLNERIPNYPQFLEDIMALFREEMINLGKK